MKVKFLSIAYLLKQINIGIQFKTYRMALLLLALTTVSLNLSANTYTVTSLSDNTNSSDLTTLRGAINAAETAGGTNVINITVVGTINLTNGEITFGNNANESLTINGLDSTRTIINMTTTKQDRIFLINSSGTVSGVTVNISNIKFTNGLLKSDTYGGGAIAAGAPSNNISISNCAFTNNSDGTNTGYGGGAIVFTFGGSLNITGCSFSNNSSEAGGAVHFYSYSSTVNNAYLYPNASLSITNCVFNNNSSSGSGGGISLEAAGYSISNNPTIGQPTAPTLSVNIARNTFINNKATGSGSSGGGAISVTNSFNTTTIFNINFNRFVGNTASSTLGSAIISYDTQGNTDATNNWWDCTSGPSVCSDKVYRYPGSSAGNITSTPYLLLTTTAATSPLCPLATSTIVSSFTVNSAGTTISTANLSTLIGLPIVFSASLGSISNQQATIQSNGTATATFIAGNTAGAGSAAGMVDNGTASAAITVNGGTSIGTNPGTSTVCAGSTASLSATATGTSLTYQWRKGTTNISDGATGTGSTISGSNTASLSISNAGTSDAGTNYNVVVSGTCGAATSTNGTVVVNIPGTWIGGSNTSWTTAANWACGAVPTGTTNVTIPVTSNAPTLTGSGTCNSITINSGATLTLAASATLDIKGDFVLNGTLTVNNGSTTSFSGGSQAVAGTTYYNLLLNGAGSKTLSSAATVNNTLTLTAGTLSLGSNNLTIGNTGSISGGNSSSYIVTNSTGALVQQNIGTGGRTGAISFPVGSSTSSYTPATLTNTGTSDSYTVAVQNSLSSSYNTSDVATGTTQSANAVGRTWLVKEATAGNSNVTLALQWNAADELTSFTRANCYVSHFYNGFWHPGSSSGATGSNPYTQTISGINTFSPFGVGSAGSILPLNLLSFMGSISGNIKQLAWSTSAEINFDSFVVERSVNGVDFSAITAVAATGNNNAGINKYSYADASGTASIYYYRLKMVDKDGTFTYSNIVAINNASANSNKYHIKVTPNPFQSNIWVNMDAPQDAQLTFELIDMNGKKLLTQYKIISQGNNNISINQLDNIAHGTYLLHFFNKDINQTIKLIKIK